MSRYPSHTISDGRGGNARDRRRHRRADFTSAQADAAAADREGAFLPVCHWCSDTGQRERWRLIYGHLDGGEWVRAGRCECRGRPTPYRTGRVPHAGLTSCSARAAKRQIGRIARACADGSFMRRPDLWWFPVTSIREWGEGWTFHKPAYRTFFAALPTVARDAILDNIPF